MAAYGRLPLSLSRGEGVWVWDTQGKRYLDALGGIAVTALGHSNEAIAAAISDQARTLTHCSNLYEIPYQESLGDALCGIAAMDKVFFCNSGAEANEAAIKIARLHGHQRGIENPTVIVMSDSFHGRTLATLTATGNRKIQAGFEPLVPGFVRAPFSDIEALEKIAANNRDIVAVMLEPIQGEGGVNPASPGYLRAVRELCDRHNWLMLADEIQSGMGRTGKWFACQHENVTPDVMTVAKALGNGFPIGACMARGAAAELIQPGSHGTTFGGSPLACRVALTVIEEMKSRQLVERAGALGEKIRERLAQEIKPAASVVDIRGNGLMIGIELDRDCAELVAKGLDAGILLNVTAARVVRLLPAYIMSDEEVDELISRVSNLVNSFLAIPQDAMPA
ncbi:MAG: aspartate aminotransferase family protein [Gammaproteobacteria bacterium]|nr:aspartate aminotransferase family protein [Gammaproteobacteria bacterium]